MNEWREWVWSYLRFRAGLTAFVVMSFLFSITLILISGLLHIEHEIVAPLCVLLGSGFAGYLLGAAMGVNR